MKRVLHVVGGMDRGGVETMIMNLYRAIDRSQIQFDILCMQDGKHHYDEEIEGMGGRIFHIKPPRERGVIRHINDIRSVILKNGPYNVVHGHTNFHTGLIALASKLSDVNIRICHSHNTSESNNNKLIRKIYFEFMKYIIRRNSTKMLACGTEAGKHLFGNRRVELGLIEVFPNAIDLNKFKIISEDEKIKLRRELNIPENTIIIGNIARFTEQKNHAFFVELIKALEKRKIDYRVVFIGDGKLREDISLKIKHIGFSSKVLFLGIRSDIPQLLNMFDVFLMPSFYEGLPVSIIEAQAIGIPCLVSDTITEEVDMGLGLISFLSLKSSCEEWIDKIIAISNENREIDRNSINNALSKNGYEINGSVTRLKKIYDLS